MATEVLRRTVITPLKVPKGDPPAPVQKPYHAYAPLFQTSTHASLRAISGAGSPPLSSVQVTVVNASDGRTVPMALDKSDTVGKVKSLFLLARPDLSPGLDLACNGKPALDHQTLEMLNVKEKALFITFQKCVGG